MAFSKEQAERYSRHFILKEIGVSGQKKLLASKVLVIGAGGLGSTALLYLAAAGVGMIGIADGDVVDMSNLNRQIIHSAGNIGMLKTESARKRILEIDPDIHLRLHSERMTAENIRNVIRDYDIILDCTDRFESKFLINDACVIENKPYVHAGAVRFEGQIMTCVPKKSPCLRCVLGEIPENAESCSDSGVFGALPGMLGCIQATEAVKYLLGIGDLLAGRILHIDGLTMRMQTIDAGKPRSDCPVCGEDPVILSPDGTNYGSGCFNKQTAERNGGLPV